MIGKGWVRSGDHAGAMGESNGDLNGMEVVNEYDYQPAAGVNRYAVGSYATGQKQRGIRNFAMNWPGSGAAPTPGTTPQVNPLNFGDLGYDVTGGQVHADGEIWSKANFAIRSALAAGRRGLPVVRHGVAAPVRERRAGGGPLPGEPAVDPARLRRVPADADRALDARGSRRVPRRGPAAVERSDADMAVEPKRAVARVRTRRFGEGAFSTNTCSNDNDTDPMADFASPAQHGAKVVFRRSRRTTATLSPVTRGSTPAGTRAACRRSRTPIHHARHRCARRRGREPRRHRVLRAGHVRVRRERGRLRTPAAASCTLRPARRRR